MSRASSSIVVANVLDSEIVVSESCSGARGVMVIVVENGHGDTCSHPGQD